MKDKDRRTSFYQSGGRHATFLHPKSPLDAEYHIGCNDELISTASSDNSLDTKQRDARKATQEWMQQYAAAAKVKLAVPCKSTTPLKRSPLPYSVFWNGKGGLELEKFIDKFTGHVTQ